MSLILNVEILGEFKKLTEATTGASNQLNTLNKTSAKISRSINTAFAAIGVGLSLRALINEFQDATKEAINDAKSQELLATAMLNTGKATDETVKSAEAYIGKMQFTASVADDQLRPAYQKLFIATGDVTKSNQLLAVALDASAATGKSLDAVSQAMAKSLAGSDTALVKLIPSLKGSKQPLDDLAVAFKGAAEKAAATDPYQRMTVVFQDLQEKIGTALLPVLEKFSAWVASPEGQAKLGNMITLITGLADKFSIMAGFVIDNADQVVAWSGVIAVAGIALKAFSVGMGIYNTVAKAVALSNTAVAASETAIGVEAGVATTSVTALSTALGVLSKLGALALVLSLSGDTAQTGTNPNLNKIAVPNAPKLGVPSVPNTNSMVTKLFGPGATTTNNVNINVSTNNATAQDIKKTLTDWYQATGSTAVLTR